METIYLKITIPKSATECNEIREQGYFFENIANAIELDRNLVSEIDEENYLKIIEAIKVKFGKEK